MNSNKMINKFFIRLLGLLCVFGMASVQAIPIIAVDMDPLTDLPIVESSASGNIGDTIQIEIVATNLTGENIAVGGMRFELGFDSSIMAFSNAVLSSPFASRQINLGNAASGEIGFIFAMTGLGQLALNQDSVLALLEFDLLASGNSELNIFNSQMQKLPTFNPISLTWTLGTSIDHSTNSGQMIVSAQQQVPSTSGNIPEPGSLALLGLGLLGLAVDRRRKKHSDN